MDKSKINQLNLAGVPSQTAAYCSVIGRYWFTMLTKLKTNSLSSRYNLNSKLPDATWDGMQNVHFRTEMLRVKRCGKVWNMASWRTWTSRSWPYPQLVTLNLWNLSVVFLRSTIISTLTHSDGAKSDSQVPRGKIRWDSESPLSHGGEKNLHVLPSAAAPDEGKGEKKIFLYHRILWRERETLTTWQ